MSVACHDFMTCSPHHKMDKNIQNTFIGGESRPVTLRSSTTSGRSESDTARRRSLNISHFNALQNAVSNLSRIDDYNLEELGYGFYSDVFKVTHKQTGKVMVLKRNKSTNSKMNILREVQLMNRLSHPNILRFKGVCVHEGQLHALTEFINGGDIDQLVTKKNVILSWKQRMQLALDVAKGMRYLHSVGIFHRDLSAKNCLVQVTTDKRNKKKYSAFVADLGLAEKIPTTPEEASRLAVVGTPYIIAPEVLKSKPYDEKADVFSYGLLVCQLIALVSYDPVELPRSSDFGLSRDIFGKMVAGSRNDEQGHSTTTHNSLPPPKLFLQLAYDCCEIEPKIRPSFDQIVTSLEEIISAHRRKKIGRSSSHRACDVNSRSMSGESNRRHGVSEGSDDSIPAAKPQAPRKKSHSASRLSRSFSDISRELLNHAANMVASSSLPSPVDDVMSDESVYSNPFSAFEHLNQGQIKLTDEPSLALLEMTFDLATSNSLKTMWSNQTNSLKRRRRLKSTYLADDHQHFEHFHHSPVSPQTTSTHDVHTFDSKSAPQSPRCQCVSEELLTDCNECNYQRALHRAAILSPRGNSLTSWWCSRKRSDAKSSLQSERQSLATLVSVLSKNKDRLRHSISLPDLPRINNLFHSSTKTIDCNQEDNTLRDALGQRSARSQTFHELSTINSPPELTESEADLEKLNSIKLSDLKSSRKLQLSRSSSDNPLFDNLTSTDGVELKKSNLNTSPSDYVSAPKHPNSESSSPISLHNKDKDCESNFSASFSSSASTDDVENTCININDRIPSSEETNSDLCLSHPNNRDSGYEDTVAPGENPHSMILSPRSRHNHHHVTWNIPEETSDPNPPPSIPVLGGYRLGTCMPGGVKDWNGNDRPGIHGEYVRHGPVQ